MSWSALLTIVTWEVSDDYGGYLGSNGKLGCGLGVDRESNVRLFEWCIFNLAEPVTQVVWMVLVLGILYWPLQIIVGVLRELYS